MDLYDEFEVPLPVAEAWAVLTDIEKITPCLPGIWLLEVEGEKYEGVVKVKVGPVTVWYEGIARYLLLDAAAHKAVLKAEGSEIHGLGKAPLWSQPRSPLLQEAPMSKPSRLSPSTAGSPSSPPV